MALDTSKRALVIFRRDLRIVDNTALLAACASGLEVVPCFIIDPRQVGSHPYRSKNGLAFMVDSLIDLQQALSRAGGRLYLFAGVAEELVPQLIDRLNIAAIFVNKDYTPFSRARDKAIAEGAAQRGVAFKSYSDLLLCEPSEFSKPDGGAYSVFTPFFKRASQISVPAPRACATGVFMRSDVAEAHDDPLTELAVGEVARQRQLGGRAAGLSLLDNVAACADYQAKRDVPALAATTRLAAHHKFGTISIRETYHRIHALFGPTHPLIRQLYWRDFFTHIAWHFPHVFKGAFHRRYDSLVWSNQSQDFERWCAGQTGFPIVDAGMRELVQTGSMHNRVRMIVASFLTKDLHCSWQWGERFFAEHLTDYEPAVNNGSWQWAASTGCDAQPYFRIFNPWLQQERFDADAVYIKRWLPELRGVSAQQLHRLYQDGGLAVAGYPAPMVDHGIAKLQAQEMFEGVG